MARPEALQREAWSGAAVERRGARHSGQGLGVGGAVSVLPLLSRLGDRTKPDIFPTSMLAPQLALWPAPRRRADHPGEGQGGGPREAWRGVERRGAAYHLCFITRGGRALF